VQASAPKWSLKSCGFICYYHSRSECALRLPQRTSRECPCPKTPVIVLSVVAEGVQIYESKVKADGVYEWTLKAPEAQLKNLSGEVLGKHFGGPAWSLNDGSKLIGNLPPLETVISPDGRNIAWLLVAAKSRSEGGLLSTVDYVARIATSGGVAPEVAPKGPSDTARTELFTCFYENRLASAPLNFDPLNFRAEFAELFIDHLVPAIDVVDPVNLGRSVGQQPRQNQGGRGPQIASHDRRTTQVVHPSNSSRGAIQFDSGSHSLQLGNMHEPLREDVFRHRTFAGNSREQGTHLGLHICRKTRISLGLQIQRFRGSVGANRERAIGPTDTETARLQSVRHRAQVISSDPVDDDFPARNGAGD
jgi:hypothetical protein